MLEIFHETVHPSRSLTQSEFFTLKELEKIAPSGSTPPLTLREQKGIVQQSVKEILDELVSDDLVTFDKMCARPPADSLTSAGQATVSPSHQLTQTTGPSRPRRVQWWVPAFTYQKQSQLSKAQDEDAALAAKIDEAEVQLEAAMTGREDTDERRALVGSLDAARALRERITAELAAFGAADPHKYEEKARAVGVAKRAVGLWTGGLWKQLINNRQHHGPVESSSRQPCFRRRRAEIIPQHPWVPCPPSHQPRTGRTSTSTSGHPHGLSYSDASKVQCTVH